MDEAIKNFDATKANDEPLYCIACERKIPDGNWFARIKVGDRRVALCRPECVELFLEHPDRGDGTESKPPPAGAPTWEVSFNRQAREGRDRVVVGSSEACAS